jgi:hypothetical protein
MPWRSGSLPSRRCIGWPSHSPRPNSSALPTPITSRRSTTAAREFIYDTAVTPNWIGKTDSFWYAYRTSKGKTWWRVDPDQATKVPPDGVGHGVR